jgi:hypothetical protein
MADHVHLLIRLRTDTSLADCMRVVKTNSSRWVKERWPEQHAFAWQGGYGAFSVSESNRLSVIRYIQDQAQHHRRISYQDEFLALLRRHGVDFDERYGNRSFARFAGFRAGSFSELEQSR